jgi:hypothetical protein
MYACLLASAFCLPAQDGRITINAGGGVGVPLNPTADFAGVGGAFSFGVGENFSQHNALVGEFWWHGLPPTLTVKTQLAGGRASSNLYALTANFRHSRQITTKMGWYVIMGGGWFYRHTSISQQANVPVACTPVYDWWGYPCSGGYVVTLAEASAGSSALGADGGLGLTLRLGDSRWKFYIESRYIYAGSHFISTQASPVTFGIRYQ